MAVKTERILTFKSTCSVLSQVITVSESEQEG